MFTIFQSCPIKDCGPEDQSWRQTHTVCIGHSKPTLIATCSRESGLEGSFHTYAIASLEEYLTRYKDPEPPPLQLQLLMPQTPKQNGLEVHDIVSIRTGLLAVHNEESDKVTIQSVEQFITTKGECLTFKSLESGELIPAPLEEVYRCTEASV